MIDASQAKTSSKYIPRLDALRALSIGLVIFEHWVSQRLGLGIIGVTTFFVISGYLITGLIVNDVSNPSTVNAAANFFWRRTLRLFPAYYFCIAILYIFNIGDIKQTLIYNLLYISNFKIAIDNSWNGSGHFWSLAIEEQFYLIWFFLLIHKSRRKRQFIIITALCVAPLFRMLMFIMHQGQFKTFLLPGVADSLAAGALVYHLKDKVISHLNNYTMWLTFGSLSLSALFMLRFYFHIYSFVFFVFLRDIATLIGILLLLMGLSHDKHILLRWMDWKWIQHIGKVSYGIYIYHYFIFPIIHKCVYHHLILHITSKSISHYSTVNIIRQSVAKSFDYFGIITILLSLITLFIVVELSWRIIELPALRLKNRKVFGIVQ